MERFFSCIASWLAVSFLIGIIFLSASGAVQAQIIPRFIKEGEFYATVRAGKHFPDNQVAKGAVLLELPLEGEWHIGGAAGFVFPETTFGQWRIEGETVRFNDKAKQLLIDGNDVAFEGDHLVNTIMVNLFHDFTKISHYFVPYLGIGLGGAQIYPRIDYPPVRFYDKDAITLGYQFIGGFSLPVHKHIYLDWEVRYFATPEVGVDRHIGEDRSIVQKLKADYEAVVLVGGIRLQF